MSKFKDNMESASTQEFDSIKKQNRQYAREIEKLAEELETVNRTLEASETIMSASLKPPTWLSPKKPAKTAATIVVMLSDTHFDEVVVAEEVDGQSHNRHSATEEVVTECGENEP